MNMPPLPSQTYLAASQQRVRLETGDKVVIVREGVTIAVRIIIRQPQGGYKLVPEQFYDPTGTFEAVFAPNAKVGG